MDRQLSLEFVWHKRRLSDSANFYKPICKKTKRYNKQNKNKNKKENKTTMCLVNE